MGPFLNRAITRSALLVTHENAAEITKVAQQNGKGKYDQILLFISIALMKYAVSAGSESISLAILAYERSTTRWAVRDIGIPVSGNLSIR